jgi:hypothetical protein
MNYFDRELGLGKMSIKSNTRALRKFWVLALVQLSLLTGPWAPTAKAAEESAVKVSVDREVVITSDQNQVVTVRISYSLEENLNFVEVSCQHEKSTNDRLTITWAPWDQKSKGEVEFPLDTASAKSIGRYTCVITLDDALGVSYFGKIEFIKKPAGTSVPGVPQAFVSFLSPEAIKIKWFEPEITGGLPLTDYLISFSSDGGLNWTSDMSLGQGKARAGYEFSLGNSAYFPALRSLQELNLKEGQVVLVRFAAKNVLGTSSWSYIDAKVPLENLYSREPSFRIVDSTKSSVIIATMVKAAAAYPTFDVSPDGGTTWISPTQDNPPEMLAALGETAYFQMNKLVANKKYLFRFRTCEFGGSCSETVQLEATTKLDTNLGPKAPTSIKISSVKTNAASLSWSSVVASPKVSDYLVDVSTDGSTWVPVSKKVSTSTMLSLSGLRLGTSYQVRVAAVNSVGTGSHVYGSFTTLATVSTAPTALVSSSVSSSGFTLNWNAPTSNGGANITDYVVEINGGGFTWSPISHEVTGDTSITVSGLNPGIKYTVRVKAANRVGISKSSTSLYVTTLATTPGTVTGLTVKSVSATGAVITWTAPNAGGAKISDYLAEVSTDNGQTWKAVAKSASSSTSLTLKGLKTKSSYLVRVTPKNTVGYGAVSQNLRVATS